MIYVNVDSPNLGFTYLNYYFFFGGGAVKNPPCSMSVHHNILLSTDLVDGIDDAVKQLSDTLLLMHHLWRSPLACFRAGSGALVSLSPSSALLCGQQSMLMPL